MGKVEEEEQMVKTGNWVMEQKAGYKKFRFFWGFFVLFWTEGVSRLNEGGAYKPLDQFSAYIYGSHHEVWNYRTNAYKIQARDWEFMHGLRGLYGNASLFGVENSSSKHSDIRILLEHHTTIDKTGDRLP